MLSLNMRLLLTFGTIASLLYATGSLHGQIQPEVPMTGISYSVAGALFSPRAGCRVFPPASFGIDFAAMCLTRG